MIKNISMLINEITLWKKNNPSAFFHKVFMDARNLRYVIESIVDNGTYEGINKSFFIPCSSIHVDRVSNDQFRVFQRYRNACTEIRNAEREFIKLFTSELS